MQMFSVVTYALVEQKDPSKSMWSILTVLLLAALVRLLLSDNSVSVSVGLECRKLSEDVFPSGLGHTV